MKWGVALFQALTTIVKVVTNIKKCHMSRQGDVTNPWYAYENWSHNHLHLPEMIIMLCWFQQTPSNFLI
jgi:hypothetical protein